MRTGTSPDEGNRVKFDQCRSTRWTKLRPQLIVLLFGIALAVYAWDLNAWLVSSLGRTVVATWRNDLGLPFELLWVAGFFIIGVLSGAIARFMPLPRTPLILLLAGPFAISALAAGGFAVFMFGAHSGPLGAAFMFMYPITMVAGVFASTYKPTTVKSAA